MRAATSSRSARCCTRWRPADCHSRAQALEKDHNLRYQHASEMRSGLQRLKRDSESGHGKAPSAVGSKEQLSVRRFRWWILAPAVAAAAIAFTLPQVRNVFLAGAVKTSAAPIAGLHDDY